MTNRQSDDDTVWLKLVATKRAKHWEQVSVKSLSEASEFFSAFFRHTLPLSTSTNTSGERVFRLSIDPEEKKTQLSLLRCAHGESLQLTESNVAWSLRIADRWRMEAVLKEIATFLKSYLETSATSTLKKRAKHDAEVFRIVQVLKLYNAALQFGASLDQRPEFVEVHKWCYRWLCRQLPYILENSSFSVLTEAIVEELIKRCKRKIKPEDCASLWDRYRRIAEHASSTKRRQMQIAEEMKEHCMSCILRNPREVMKSDSFQSFLSGGWDIDVVSDLLCEIVNRLTPDNSVQLHEALFVQTMTFDRRYVRRGTFLQYEYPESREAELLASFKNALEATLQYRQRNAVAVLWSDEYKKLRPEMRRSVVDNMSFSESAQNAGKDKSRHNGAFIALNTL